MTIELRLRAAGMLFYLVFGLSLLASQASQNIFNTLSSQSFQPDIFQTLATIAGAGAIVFTSEAIGFAFNSVFVFFWNIVRGGFGQREGGYSAEWQKLGYEPKAYIIEQYKNVQKASNGGTYEQKFEKQWESYSAAVFLSYLWQQYAPPQVETWVSRRHTAFFAGMSTAIAIGLAVVLSAIIIETRDMGWTYTNSYVSISSLILMAMIYSNAQHARREVWQTIDLWLAGILNPRLGTILNNIQADRKIVAEKRTVESEQLEE